MLFFIPLLAATTFLQALIPGVPAPETFVPTDAAARGTDVSLWILQQCPSTVTTLAELELALQLGSSDPLAYSVPLGLHVWHPFPSVRARGRTLLTSANHLLPTSGVKLSGPRRLTRHTRVPRLEALPNGTATDWCTCNDRNGRSSHVYLALAMAQIGPPLPAVLTLPAPTLVLGLPAPSPILTLPAPRPVLSLPAPAPVLSLPVPKPVLSITVPGIALVSLTPTSTHTLAAPKSIFTQPPVKASSTSEIPPMFSTPNPEAHVSPSPGSVPFCAQPTLAATMALPLPPASEVSAALSAPTRGFYPVVTKPVVHSTTRKWHNHFSMARFVVLTLGLQLAASRSFEGLVRHLVGVNYLLDDEIPGERSALDPFGGLAFDMQSNTARSGMFSGLAPDLFRFCDQPEPIDATFGDGMEQAVDPFNKLAIDTFDVARSGRLSGLAPDLFRSCDQPELPGASLEDTLDEPLGSKGVTEGADGEDAREEAREDVPVEMKEAEGESKMDGATASCDILVDDGARGLSRRIPGPDSAPSQSVDTQLEPEGVLSEVEVEARQVDTADDSVGDSSGGLKDPFRPVKFDWPDGPLEPNGTMTMADATSRSMDPQTGLEEPEEPEPNPSHLAPEREGAQYGGAGTSSSRWMARAGEGGLSSRSGLCLGDLSSSRRPPPDPYPLEYLSWRSSRLCWFSSTTSTEPFYSAFDFGTILEPHAPQELEPVLLPGLIPAILFQSDHLYSIRIQDAFPVHIFFEYTSPTRPNVPMRFHSFELRSQAQMALMARLLTWSLCDLELYQLRVGLKSSLDLGLRGVIRLLVARRATTHSFISTRCWVPYFVDFV